MFSNDLFNLSIVSLVKKKILQDDNLHNYNIKTVLDLKKRFRIVLLIKNTMLCVYKSKAWFTPYGNKTAFAEQEDV